MTTRGSGFLTIGDFDVSEYVEDAVRSGWQMRYHSPEFVLMDVPTGGWNLLLYHYDRPGRAWLMIPERLNALRYWLAQELRHHGTARDLVSSDYWSRHDSETDG